MAQTYEEWLSWWEQMKRDLWVVADKYEYKGDNW